LDTSGNISSFEEFLEDGIHEKAILNAKYKRLGKKLQQVFLISLAIIFLGGIFVFGENFTVDGILEYVLGFFIVLMSFFLFAIFISAPIALIPFKRFNYSQRITLLILGVLVLSEIAFSIGLLAKVLAEISI
jgi:hypothetical protein